MDEIYVIDIWLATASASVCLSCAQNDSLQQFKFNFVMILIMFTHTKTNPWVCQFALAWLGLALV